MEFTKEMIEKLNNTTVKELAMQLEDGLLNSCYLREDLSVAEFIKLYLE